MAAAANHITRNGFADLVLDRVAADAGYTRGALYHLFANKEELVLAVMEWVRRAWHDAVGFLLTDDDDPVGTLIAVARNSTVHSRNDAARALSRLRTEFAGTDHPVEKAFNELVAGYVDDIVRLIKAGRTSGAIPTGPPARVVATAYLAAIDGIVNHLSDHEPFDVLFVERAILGVLGLSAASDT
jgi:AcrR family transcriptional regulator